MDIEKDDELEEDPDQFLTANEIEQKRIEEERRKREEEERNATTYKEWMAKEREVWIRWKAE